MATASPPDAAGKLPPQNQEAEVSVLGAILLSEQALDGLLIDVKLRPEDFYRQRHRLIFHAMIRLKEKAEPEPVDVLTVCEELGRRGELEEAGGTAYVHSLPNLVPAAGNVRQYGRIVKDHSLLRRLLDTTRRIQDDVFTHSGEPQQLLEQAEGALYRIAHDEHTGELRPIEAVLHDELEKLERVSREGVSLTGTPSGFTDIDNLTGGFQPGNLIILAARPSMGKCLSANALVYCPRTGDRRRIADVVAAHERGEQVWIAALDNDLRLRPARVAVAAPNGRKPLYRLRTKLGRSVEATANHPLLTVSGWRRLDALRPGDRIAVPRTLPRVGRRREMPDHEVVLLAATIAAEDRFVPEEIFRLDDPQIARFLSVLYGRDGHVYASDRLRQVGYTTISERLAHDVQHLLLRLGIVSEIRTLKRAVDGGADAVAREVVITGEADLMAFCDRVGAVGKEDRVERLRAGVARSRAQTNVDTIRAEVSPQILEAVAPGSMRRSAVATGPSRPLLHEVGSAAGDQSLTDLATSQVWWDEIVSIDYVGDDETYDLCVPDHHNFVADDIVVHNSALVTNMAENASVKHGRPVALFSLEMSETELAQRFIASQAKLNGDDLRKGRVKPDRWPKVMQATETLAAAPLYIDDSSDVGILELRAKTRRLHSRTPLGLVVVDYLQLMRPEDTSNSRVEQIGQISRGLKLLARELDIPVIAVSQLSRAVEARPDKKPMLSDLRESGQIEQDADLVMFIYRDEYYNREESERPGEADIIIAKHRNGPVGDVSLTFLERYPKFMNLTRRDPDVPIPLEADAP